MPREIKFRAWDGKTMFNIDVLAISPCTWSCPDYGKRGVSLAYQPNITVMQYTGLKDKNGKEIFEGDILKIIEVSNTKSEEYNTPVVFEDAAFLVQSGTDDYDTFLAAWAGNPDISYPLFELEVIGNIYENPELLEKGVNENAKT